jgi:hypothetical protein
MRRASRSRKEIRSAQCAACDLGSKMLARQWRVPRSWALVRRVGALWRGCLAVRRGRSAEGDHRGIRFLVLACFHARDDRLRLHTPHRLRGSFAPRRRHGSRAGNRLRPGSHRRHRHWQCCGPVAAQPRFVGCLIRHASARIVSEGAILPYSQSLGPTRGGVWCICSRQFGTQCHSLRIRLGPLLAVERE